MTLSQIASRALSGALGLSLVAATALGGSRYAVPFENLRRTHDSVAFGHDLRTAQEQPAGDLGQDISYLVDVVSSSDGDPTVQDQALQELYVLAYSLGNVATEPIEGFRPAINVFEKHLDEAVADPNSKWSWSIASLTAFAGLQPNSPRTATAFRRILGAKDERLRGVALVALARLHPRPLEAKEALLAGTNRVDRDTKLLVLSYALDDPDLLGQYTRFMASQDVEEQRSATKLLVGSGALAKPALEALYRLRQQKDLDPEVAKNVKMAIDQIEKSGR